MSTELSEKIHKLRADGLSYRQIQTELACSRGTISYHLGKGQKEKTYNRKLKSRSNQHPYTRKVENFKITKTYKNKPKPTHKWYKLISVKIQSFHKDRKTMKYKKTESDFNVQDVINKFGENPNCYLTGDSIDIYKPRTYEFDHIFPVSKGGSNSIDNLGICTKNANRAKNDMTLEQFVNLCKKVVEIHK